MSHYAAVPPFIPLVFGNVMVIVPSDHDGSPHVVTDYDAV